MTERPSPLAPPPGVRRHWAKRKRTELSSLLAGVGSTMIAFPLESIKTRVQGDSPSVRVAVTSLWREEGLRGFWRGSIAPVWAFIITRTFSFKVYQEAKYRASALVSDFTGEEQPLLVANRPGSVPTMGTIACFSMAGAVAGAVTTFITCPFEMVKTGMVLSRQIASTGNAENHGIRSSYMNKWSYGTARQIVQNCGPLSLYAGFRLQFIRETAGTAVYFATYESVKQYVVKWTGSSDPSHPLAALVGGSACGMISTMMTYPLDRAKTAYQKERLELGKFRPSKPRPSQYFKRASYQGMGVAAARSATTNAIFFLVFEAMKKQINQLPDPTY